MAYAAWRAALAQAAASSQLPYISVHGPQPPMRHAATMASILDVPFGQTLRRLRAMRRPLTGTALTASLLACGDKARVGTPAANEPVVQHPARYGSAPTFTLDSVPVRDIGGLKERAEDEFDHLNGLLHAVVLENGGLAVIDNSRVRLYDAAGAQIAVVGRAGRGPGEFTGLTQLCRFAGDSLLVLDQLRRLAVISPRGEIVRERTLEEIGIASSGCFHDGSFLTQPFDRNAGREVQSAPAVRTLTDGSVVDTVGTLPRFGLRGVAEYVRLHARGAHLYVSDPRTSEVRRYAPDGSLELVLRTADVPRAMSAADASYWLGGPQAAAGSGRVGGAQPDGPATTWPFYRDLLIDASGRLWIRDFPETHEAPDRFAVYDSTGAFVGRLDVPRGPRRTVRNPRTGAPITAPGVAPQLIDAVGDTVILLVRDADGAAHFESRLLRPIAP
jgi:hypothetical protein